MLPWLRPSPAKRAVAAALVWASACAPVKPDGWEVLPIPERPSLSESTRGSSLLAALLSCGPALVEP